MQNIQTTTQSPERFFRISLPKKLQYVIAGGALSLVYSLGLPKTAEAQNKKIDQKEQPQGNKEKKEVINEREEIFKLRNKFKQGKYGSQYLMGLLDGHFVGPNNQTDYGLRTYTTAYDYLILGDNLLTLLVNLGYTSSNSDFISTEQDTKVHPYKLGCIQSYTISGEKYLMDSVYSTQLDGWIPVKDAYMVTDSRLQIDSGQVEVSLAGLVWDKKKREHVPGDTLTIPQIEGTGSWKDANNYDMAYERMEFIFAKYQDAYDISKRQFSKYTPEDLKEGILQCFDTKKYLEKNNKQERDLERQVQNKDNDKVYDLIHEPNGKIYKIGKYQIFRFFTDVYWRKIPESSSTNNPIWYNAFQYDDKDRADPLPFIVLSYGTKEYIMPTVVPDGLPSFSQFEGVVMYNESGSTQGDHSNKDDIRINTINGRMVNPNLFEYPHEKGILPLNDDGTVDRIYKIYARKDKKMYRAYIYCGKHARVQGGRPGKSFVEQVDEFRKQYNVDDYRYFTEDVDFKKDVVNDMAAFIQSLKNIIDQTPGLAGKTRPRINITLTSTDEKHPDKKIIEKKQLTLSEDHTAILSPDGLIVPWEIENKNQVDGEELAQTTRIKLRILDQEVYLEDLEKFLQSQKISGYDVQRSNKKYYKEKENKKPKTVQTRYEAYDGKVYDITNSEDVYILLEKMDEDIISLGYDSTQLVQSIERQTKRVEKLESELREMEKDKKTRTPYYKTTKETYEEEKNFLVEMEKKLVKLGSQRAELKIAKEQHYTTLIQALELKIEKVNEKRAFITQEIDKLKKQLQQMESEGQSGNQEYLMIQQSVTNKYDELEEMEEKEAAIRQEIQTVQSAHPTE